MKRHLLIAGTGRAGTTFLVQLLTACGLDTHLSRHGDRAWTDLNANAGLEDTIFSPAAPYVVKSPWTYLFLDRLLQSEDIGLDACILPVRKLEEAAASRVVLEVQHRYENNAHQMEEAGALWQHWGTVPGGVVYSIEPAEQMRNLAVGFHQIVDAMVAKDVPLILVNFPRLVLDPVYAYRKLAAVLPDADFSSFAEAFEAVADAGKVRLGREIAKGATEPTPTPLVDDLALEQLEAVALRRVLVKMRAERDQLRQERDSLANQTASLAAERDDAVRRLQEVEAQNLESSFFDAAHPIPSPSLAQAPAWPWRVSTVAAS